MREIKFRAWDKEFKTMIFSGFDLSKFFFDCETYYSDSPIMQYTGLKDRNGKEIYEGDIIRLKAISPIHGTQFERITEIIYEDGGFNPLAMASLNGFKFDQHFEVIGNIYENPELLK